MGFQRQLHILTSFRNCWYGVCRTEDQTLRERPQRASMLSTRIPQSPGTQGVHPDWQETQQTFRQQSIARDNGNTPGWRTNEDEMAPHSSRSSIIASPTSKSSPGHHSDPRKSPTSWLQRGSPELPSTSSYQPSPLEALRESMSRDLRKELRRPGVIRPNAEGPISYTDFERHQRLDLSPTRRPQAFYNTVDNDTSRPSSPETISPRRPTHLDWNAGSPKRHAAAGKGMSVLAQTVSSPQSNLEDITAALRDSREGPLEGCYYELVSMAKHGDLVGQEAAVRNLIESLPHAGVVRQLLLAVHRMTENRSKRRRIAADLAPNMVRPADVTSLSIDHLLADALPTQKELTLSSLTLTLTLTLSFVTP